MLYMCAFPERAWVTNKQASTTT